jgi:hypothetical protein
MGSPNDIVATVGRSNPRIPRVILAEGTPILILGLDIPTWLGVIAILVGVLAAWFFYQRAKNPLTLDYAVRSVQNVKPRIASDNERRLVIAWAEPVQADTGGAVEISKALVSPQIIDIHIRNTGKRGIDSTNFKKPITIEIKDGVIVDVNVVSVSRQETYSVGSLSDQPHLTPTCWSFTPNGMSLNDSIELQIVTDEASEVPEISCWILDETRPMRLRQDIIGPPAIEIFKNLFLRAADGLGGPAISTAAAAVVLLLVRQIFGG